MSFYELDKEQRTQLKEHYMIECVNEGIYGEIFGVDWDEPSWGEIMNADALVPDEVIEDHYSGVIFSEDDFF